jgi:hypothetical protein
MKNTKNKWIEEELTIAEFAERFLGESDFSTPNEIDTSELKIKILGKDLKTNKDVYKSIKKFIVKGSVNEYFTDGKLKGTNKHRIIEDGKEIHLEDHKDFHKETGEMKVVDFEIERTHNYYANGRLNHNTVPGGKAMAFAASVRLRLSNMGKLKGAGQKVIGNKCKVVVTKNRMGPPHRAGLFEIHYDSGIQDLTSWLDFLKDNGFARKDGDKYVIKLPSGTVKLSTREFLEKIHAEQTFKDEIYDVIATDYIMKYRPANSDIIENLSVDENVEDEG